MVLSYMRCTQGLPNFVFIYRLIIAVNHTSYQHPPRKPPPSLLSSLIHQLQVSIPVEFQLPEEIKTFFKDGSLLPFNPLLRSLLTHIEQLRRDRRGTMLIVQR